MKKILISLFLILSCNANSLEYCKDVLTTKSKTFFFLEGKIKKRLEEISNKKVVASEADQVLSKLISLKSPAITSWIKRKQFDPEKDETKIVLEWRKDYLQNFVLAKYPKKDEGLDREVEDFFDWVNKEAFPGEERVRIEKIFEKAKTLSLERASKFKMNQKEKKKILNRMEKIKLYWMNDFKSSKFSKMPLEFLSWGVAYDPVPNEINIGVEALSYPSDHNLFGVFAHEIGHSIDPCRWGAFIKGENPFSKVISCLRGKESAFARERDDSILSKLEEMKKIDKALAKSLRENPTCNKTFYPPTGYQKDQIPESFADWFAAEVISLGGLADNTFRIDLCESTTLMMGSSYLLNEERLKRIYLVQPVIKAKLKSKTAYKYCSL